MNHRIRVPEVRLIGSDGSLLGVVKTSEALKKAQEDGLDLVEISATANPPVCKILDYGKYKYTQKKKEHQSRKKQVVIHLKEVKFRPNTDSHDFDFKLKAIHRFLEEGNKAKVTVTFRGREMAYMDRGRALLKRVLEGVQGKAKVEHTPSVEGRAMIMVLAPAS